MSVACKNCGNAMNDEARFCSVCGTPASAAQGQTYSAQPGAGYAPGYAPRTRLIRPRAGRMIAGVCEGLANAYAWDVVWVRVIAVLLAIFGGGVGLVAYVVFWLVMPEEPRALPQQAAWPPQGSSQA
ncbi:MAG TPA: PspC domain-containing protein [Acidobacteriaceae bacterium]|nr:PspC domain-containing protein [Acidobacteriaceae bacterium]